METIDLRCDAEAFDKAVHGGLNEHPVLPQAGPLAVYFKPEATASGRGMAVVTFPVRLPDGSYANVQATTTAALIEMVDGALAGWKQFGLLK